MITVAEAHAAILAAVPASGIEAVELELALGRILAEDVVAQRDQPPFHNSAMDGYAVRADDVHGASAERPIALTLAGESRAGVPSEQDVSTGQAMRIFTGAALPSGADTVVAQEDTEVDGSVVHVTYSPNHGRHVRHLGSDFSKGSVLARRGERIHPGVVAVLASQGLTSVNVSRQPRVSVLATGDELQRRGSELRAGGIFDSNSPMMSALLEQAGALPRIVQRQPDEIQALVGAIRDGLDADVLISTGGVSVGDHDRVREAMRQAGVEPIFWKIRVKPGKPVAFGVAGTTLVFGLPGNPVSAFVAFHVFVRPALDRLLGRPAREPVWARLVEPHRRRPGREEFARASLRAVEAGHEVSLHEKQGSGSIHSIAQCNALALLPAETAEFPAGTKLRVLPLQ